jgi:site-specific recombinase XerD
MIAPAQINTNTKGNKPRCVPLLDIAVENLEYYLSVYHPNR